MSYTKEQRAAKAELLERQSREHESREADDIHEEYPEAYYSDYLLDTTNIPARPGFVQRWVRSTVRGEVDRSNVFKKMNRGWKPRMIDTIPKAQRILRMDFEGDQVVGIHGSILMEIPKALFDRQSQAVKSATQLQMDAVKNDLYRVHERDSGLSRPEFNNQSFVRKRGAITIDDD